MLLALHHIIIQSRSLTVHLLAPMFTGHKTCFNFQITYLYKAKSQSKVILKRSNVVETHHSQSESDWLLSVCPHTHTHT